MSSSNDSSEGKTGDAKENAPAVGIPAPREPAGPPPDPAATTHAPAPAPAVEGREIETIEGAVAGASTAPSAAAPIAATRLDPYAAFRLPVYRLYVVSFVLAVVGSQTLSTAAIYDVYDKTGSLMKVGLIGLANAIPLLVLAMPAGHVADNFSRKRVLLLTQAVLVVCPMMLSFWHTLPAMFAILVMNAVALTFGRPSRAAILPNLVPKSIFPNAVTWNSSFFELASSIAPAATGFVIARYGASVAYAVSAVAMALCMILTMFLPNILPPARLLGDGNRREPMSWKTLAVGIRFVGSRKILLAPMLLDLIAVVLSGATALMPAFADRLAGGDVSRRAVIYGWLMAAPSIGAVIMAVVQAHLPPAKRAGRRMMLAVAGYGAATIVFGMSESFWLSFAMLAMTGVFDNVSVVIRHTLVQLATPDEMRGRVSAVNQIFIISSNELGKVESGFVAAAIGPVATVVSGGIGTILLVMGLAKWSPQLMSLGSLHDVKATD